MVSTASEDTPKRKRPPARTAEGRNNQLISLAYDQAELMLREGVAPAPIVVHYLKQGTEQYKEEIAKLKSENNLLKKKLEQSDRAERIEELYAEAIQAQKHYRGLDDEESYEDYD